MASRCADNDRQFHTERHVENTVLSIRESGQNIDAPPRHSIISALSSVASETLQSPEERTTLAGRVLRPPAEDVKAM